MVTELANFLGNSQYISKRREACVCNTRKMPILFFMCPGKVWGRGIKMDLIQLDNLFYCGYIYAAFFIHL